MGRSILLILIVMGVVFFATMRDFNKGFLLAAALLVSLPSDLQISLPGALPELSVHRAIMMVLLLRWMMLPRSSEGADGRTPFRGLFLLVVASRSVSLLLSTTPMPSLKGLLAFVIEGFLYYVIACRAFQGVDPRVALVRAVIYGLVPVAIFATIEKYRGISIPSIVVPDFRLFEGDVQSTYPHRILLGYGMAMGAAVAVHLLDAVESKQHRRLIWFALIWLVCGCYFANSRGPWLGMSIAIVCSYILGSKATRRRCSCVLLLVAIVFIIRPGVRESIMNRAKNTFDEETGDGKSYSYRWRLWTVAFSEIGKSPERFIFGYGGQSTESMDLGHYFEKQAGGTTHKIGFTSWDNQYACDLIEFGVVGFITEIALYLALIWRLLLKWRDVTGATRALISSVLAAYLVFLFAQTNAPIFSIQLKFILWTVLAFGVMVPTAMSRMSSDGAKLSQPNQRLSSGSHYPASVIP